MPTSRFVVVSAPLEERVASSLATRVQGAVAEALRLKREVNATLQREDLNDEGDRGARPRAAAGGLPFVLLMLLIAVLAAARAAAAHRDEANTEGARIHDGRASAQAPTEHQHED